MRHRALLFFVASAFAAPFASGCAEGPPASPENPGTPKRELARAGEVCGGIAGIVCEPPLRCAPLAWSQPADPRLPGIADDLGRCVPQVTE